MRIEETATTVPQHAAPATVVTPSPVILRMEKRDIFESEVVTDASKRLFCSVKETRQMMDASKDSGGESKLKKRPNLRRLFRDKKSRTPTEKRAKKIQRRSRSKSKEGTVNKPFGKTKQKDSSTAKAKATETDYKPIGKSQHKWVNQSKDLSQRVNKRVEKGQQKRRSMSKSGVSDPNISKTVMATKVSLKSSMAVQERRTRRRKELRGRRRVVNSWDSLASVCSVTTNRSVAENSVASEISAGPIPKTVTQDIDEHSVAYSVLSHPVSVRQSSEDSQRSSSEKSQLSTIPPALFSVLAPKGLPRKLRTSAQILEETEAFEQTIEAPSRRALGRACKDKRKEISYNEDSDHEEGIFLQPTVPWRFPKSQSDSVCENNFGDDKSETHSLQSPNDADRPSETIIAMEDKTTGSSNPSKEGTVNSRPQYILSRRDDEDIRDGPRRSKNHLENEHRTSMAPQNISESGWSGTGEQRSSRRSRGQRPRKVSSYIVGDEDLNCELKGLQLHQGFQGIRSNNHQRSVTRDVDVAKQKRHQIDPSQKKKSINEVGTTITTRTTLQQEPTENFDSQSHSVSTKSVVQVVSKGSKKKKHSKKKKSKKKKSKVRWAPLPTATTTFSVKIRVKTSMDNGRSSSKNVQVPALDESTVQAIADQVTQACLMQARSNPGVLAPTNMVGQAAPRMSKRRILPSPTHNSVEEADDVDDDSSEEEKLRSKPSEIDVDCNSSVVSDLTRERGGRESSARKRKVLDEAVADENDYDAPMEDVESLLQEAGEPDTRLRSSPTQEQPPSIPNKSADSVTKSERSKKRRRRMWSSGDSLACSFASTSRSSPKILSSNGVSTPETAAVAKPVSPSRTARKHKGPILNAGIDSAILAATAAPAHQANEVPNQERKDETVVTDVSASVRCGICSGCSRSFDCMNCDACLARLQAGDTSFQDGAKSDCLRRVCHRLAQYDVASLGTVSQPQFRHAKNNPEQDDMSYISEVEWGTQKRKSKQGKPLSRASRLWSQQYEKPAQQRATGSTSSVTTLTGMSGPAAKAKNGRRRKGSKKNPLHYLEMPVATDGSVASWMESRRVRQALMNYDEADQDWV
ncbi:MAG: hypothetical protein SGBAC_001336 [Bacillariaceae sp.]